MDIYHLENQLDAYCSGVSDDTVCFIQTTLVGMLLDIARDAMLRDHILPVSEWEDVVQEGWLAYLCGGDVESRMRDYWYSCRVVV